MRAPRPEVVTVRMQPFTERAAHNGVSSAVFGITPNDRRDRERPSRMIETIKLGEEPPGEFVVELPGDEREYIEECRADVRFPSFPGEKGEE